jgi:hypothetical protein
MTEGTGLWEGGQWGGWRRGEPGRVGTGHGDQMPPVRLLFSK